MHFSTVAQTCHNTITFLALSSYTVWWCRIDSSQHLTRRANEEDSKCHLHNQIIIFDCKDKTQVKNRSSHAFGQLVYLALDHEVVCQNSCMHIGLGNMYICFSRKSAAENKIPEKQNFSLLFMSNLMYGIL